MLVHFESVRVMCIITCVHPQDPQIDPKESAEFWLLLLRNCQRACHSNLPWFLRHSQTSTKGGTSSCISATCMSCHPGLCFTSEHEATGLSPTLQHMPIVGWRGRHAWWTAPGMQHPWRDSNLLKGPATRLSPTKSTTNTNYPHLK